MSLGYGSSFVPSELSILEIGRILQQESRPSVWWEVLRWFIRAIEVAGSILSGGILAPLAIGVIGTAAEAGIDIAQTGEVSIGNLVQGVITAGGFGFIGAAAKTTSTGARFGLEVGTIALSNVAKEVGETLQFGQSPNALGLGLDWGLGLGIPIGIRGAARLRRIRRVNAQTISQDISNFSKSTIQKAAMKNSGINFETDINGRPSVAYGTKKQFANLANNLERNYKFENLTNEIRTNINSTTISKAQDAIENIRKTMVKFGISDFESDGIINAFKSIRVENSDDVLRMFSKILGTERANILFKNLNGEMLKVSNQVFNDMNIKNISKQSNIAKVVHSTNRGLRIVAKGSKFLDPKFLAEYSMKKLGRKLSQKLEKYIAKFKKAKKSVRKQELLFKDTGGSIINSTWILGYKTIYKLGFEFLVQISFRRQAYQNIKSQTAKNFGGKKPVYLRMTSSQIGKLKRDTGGYYLDDFAMSRGGKSSYGSFFDSLLGGAQSILSFVPVELIRNILAVASLTKRNINSFASGHWSQRFSMNFFNSWKELPKAIAPSLFKGGALGQFAQPLARNFVNQFAANGKLDINQTLSTSRTFARRGMGRERIRRLGESKRKIRHGTQIARLSGRTRSIFR